MESVGVAGAGTYVSFLVEGLSNCACSSWEVVSTTICKYVGEFFVLLGAVLGCFCGVCICSCLIRLDDSEDDGSFGAQIDICRFVQDCVYSFFNSITL